MRQRFRDLFSHLFIHLKMFDVEGRMECYEISCCCKKKSFKNSLKFMQLIWAEFLSNCRFPNTLPTQEEVFIRIKFYLYFCQKLGLHPQHLQFCLPCLHPALKKKAWEILFICAILYLHWQWSIFVNLIRKKNGFRLFSLIKDNKKFSMTYKVIEK